jgi:hypothetical protein
MGVKRKHIAARQNVRNFTHIHGLAFCVASTHTDRRLKKGYVKNKADLYGE